MLSESVGADASVHERPEGADAKQRVGAGVVHEYGLPQGDERSPSGVGRGVVLRCTDGGGHGASRASRH